MRSKAVVREVGLRDGLQLMKSFLPTVQKVIWCRAEADAGLVEIEATSFVPPKVVPQSTDAAEIAKAHIRSYCLIAFEDTPPDAWRRCLWVESHGVKALPMWYHRLDQLEPNVVLPEQQAAGWDDEQRRRIMGWFYKHRGRPLPAVQEATA